MAISLRDLRVAPAAEHHDQQAEHHDLPAEEARQDLARGHPAATLAPLDLEVVQVDVEKKEVLPAALTEPTLYGKKTRTAVVGCFGSTQRLER